MRGLTEEYLSVLGDLRGDAQGRSAALKYLQSSDVDAHGEPLNFSYVPYLVDEDLHKTFSNIVSTTHRILCKIIKHYLEDEHYRALFGYSKQLQDLIMLPCDYSQLLPMARFDIFMDEDDPTNFKFCEFNTDGTSCMSRDFVLGEALMQGEALRKFSEVHSVQYYELFDSWARVCLSNYFECPDAVETPLVVVADFMDDHATYSDFGRYVDAFKRCGADSRVVDIRDMKFDGTKLYDAADGAKIDCIYRRAVTCDVQNHIHDCQDLIEAVEQRCVCLVGHFRTTVVHTKTVNIALFLPETRSFLSDEECEFIDLHCPKTYRLEGNLGEVIDEIAENNNGWILKPEDDYGAKGVFAGPDFNKSDWKQIVTDHIGAGYVAQQYAKQFTTDVMYTGRDLDNSTPVQKFNAMPGLYCYNGEFSGIYLRCGNEGVIAVDHSGLVKPAFKVDF